MASIYRLLSPKHEFFEIFSGSADLILESARAFREMLDEYPNYGTKALHIKNLEHKADELTHRSFDLLHKTFITPFDHEDIQVLVSRLDDVIDFIDASAQRVHLYDIGKPRPEMFGMADICIRCAEHIKEAVSGLANLKKPRDLMRACVEINRLENEADNLLRSSVAALFREEADIKQLIKLKEIYELLETVTDRCEDVANVIDGIVLEYS